MGRRDIGRGQSRSGRRADRLGSRRRRHHAIRMHVWHVRMLLVLLNMLLNVLLSRFASPGVRVVVNAGMASELIRARELLAAARELAGMRLLASVSADVTSLVLETVESLVAERTLVGSRQLVGRIRGLGSGEGAVGFDNGDCGGSHVAVSLVRPFVVRLSCGGIEEIGEIHGGVCSLHVKRC